MAKITYEQPLNERIRTLLRLEHLFQQTDHSRQGTTEWDGRAIINGLIDLLQIASRPDLKTEVIKELERLASNLAPLQNNHGVDKQKLQTILDEISTTETAFHNLQGTLCQSLRDNEFLASIKQRYTIPGGTCDVDMPAFHGWLQKSSEQRIATYEPWFAELDLLRKANELILRLIRESASSSEAMAEKGFYQQSLDTDAPYQMIRVTLTDKENYFAEISGGKHRFTIRFLSINTDGRPAQVNEDISFILTNCVV